jgi:hypothetical protein
MTHEDAMPNDLNDPLKPLRIRDEPEVNEPQRQAPPDEATAVQFGEDPGSLDAGDLDEG